MVANDFGGGVREGMDYKFERPRANKTSKEQLIQSLEAVAKSSNYSEFGWRQFSEQTRIGKNTVTRQFGSWVKAVAVLKEHLKQQGIELTQKNRAIVPDDQLLSEMERIWNLLGHRPSRDEWEGSKAKFSYKTYRRRFGGLQNACLKFIEYKMGGHIAASPVPAPSQNPEPKTSKSIFVQEEGRGIGLKLRLQVLSRDGFRCIFCGRSPATHTGVNLQVDHVVPFSKTGKSTIENLQTLCQECNLGKSNNNDPMRGVA